MVNKAGRCYCVPCAEALKAKAAIAAPPAVPQNTGGSASSNAGAGVGIALIGTLLLGSSLLVQFALPFLGDGAYQTKLIGGALCGLLLLAAGMIKLFKRSGKNTAPQRTGWIALAICGSLLGLFLAGGVVMVRVYKTSALPVRVVRHEPTPPPVVYQALAPIVMVDSSLLQNDYHVVTDMGFKMRLPRGWMIDPSVAAANDATVRRFGLVSLKGGAAIIVSLNCRDDAFDTFVDHGVNSMTQANQKILVNGVAAMGDRKVRVVQSRTPAGSQPDLEFRDIYVDGPNNIVYAISCQFTPGSFDRYSAIFDSASSTFALIPR
jgi:hypothetical protein